MMEKVVVYFVFVENGKIVILLLENSFGVVEFSGKIFVELDYVVGLGCRYRFFARRSFVGFVWA